jgi:plastocyanin
MRTHHNRKRPATAFYPLLPVALILLPCMVHGLEPPREIAITMGDYHYAPDFIEMDSGETIVLHVTNTDGITPHNFTLVDQPAGLDVDTDISAGNSARISLTPQRPGTYTWYCSKKLPLMKSHRDRGMQGTLVVRQAHTGI